MTPAEVIEVLNHYLSEMTDAIMDHGGTLVAYMGDGIMAVFGAPIEQPDHADRAIAAAHEMLDGAPAGLLRVDAQRGARRRLPDGDRAEQRRGDVRPGRLRAAHGVHDDRRHHEHGIAPRGDDERLGHQIFVADSTRSARLKQDPDLVPVGEFEVRGRKNMLTVWSLPDEESR